MDFEQVDSSVPDGWEPRCMFGDQRVAHVWVPLSPGASVPELERDLQPLGPDAEEVILGHAWMRKRDDGLFDLAMYRAWYVDLGKFAALRVWAPCPEGIGYSSSEARGVQGWLESSQVWLTYGRAPREDRDGVKPEMRYVHQVRRAEAAVASIVAEAGAEGEVWPWLERGADGALAAHLVLTDHASARNRAAAEAVAEKHAAQLVMCPGCTSATGNMVRGEALERLGLADVREPVEDLLRREMLPRS